MRHPGRRTARSGRREAWRTVRCPHIGVGHWPLLRGQRLSPPHQPPLSLTFAALFFFFRSRYLPFQAPPPGPTRRRTQGKWTRPWRTQSSTAGHRPPTPVPRHGPCFQAGRATGHSECLRAAAGRPRLWPTHLLWPPALVQHPDRCPTPGGGLCQRGGRQRRPRPRRHDDG